MYVTNTGYWSPDLPGVLNDGVAKEIIEGGVVLQTT
jgi:hypothetical protein